MKARNPFFCLPSFCRLLLSAFLTAASVGAQIPAPTDAPKPRTPEESAAAFKLPAGYRGLREAIRKRLNQTGPDPVGAAIDAHLGVVSENGVPRLEP